jgi:hypothetical protein
LNKVELINRRKFERFSFEDTFILESEKFTGISKTSSINLSQKGAHLVCLTSFPKGSIVSIEVPSQKIQMMGEVCWISPNKDQKFDVGVTFHDFFPATKAKIANLMDQIQTQPDSSGPVFSFELEKDVSQFLNTFIEDVQHEHIVQAPAPHRRLGMPAEKSSTLYTPSKPFIMEGTTTPLRIHEKIDPTNFPLRPVLLTLLALSLFLFRETFTSSLVNLTSQSKYVARTTSKPKAIAQSTAIGSEINQVSFQDGWIEKIQWFGALDKLQMTFSFRSEIQSDQVQITKISFDDHPRQLIKITNIDTVLEQKNIQVDHALVNQVRMGIHEEDGQKNLHIVVDMTSSNVSMASSKLDPKKLTINLWYTPAKY